MKNMFSHIVAYKSYISMFVVEIYLSQVLNVQYTARQASHLRVNRVGSPEAQPYTER